MNTLKSARILSLALVLVLAISAFAPFSVSAKGKKSNPYVVKNCTTSIVDVALSVNAQSGEFSTLIAALSAAGLVSSFDCDSKGMGKVSTVFAPTDEAFAKLGLNAGNIGSAFPKGTLRNILLYHVTRGALPSSAVVATSSIRMRNGGTVGVSIEGSDVFLTSNNDPSKIIGLDVMADNGVIHIIDTVLLP
jgi:uncharacterized surface protein with fasciclin (FAS1) repeats